VVFGQQKNPPSLSAQGADLYYWGVNIRY